MIILEGIGAEILPLGKFGKYLREHHVNRTEQYAWEIVKDAVRHFNPHMPEHEIRGWFDARRNDERDHWENHLLPAIMVDLEKSAQWYVRQHRGESGDEEE